MTNPPKNHGQRLILPSLSPRNLSKASKNHLTGFFVLGDGQGVDRVVGTESHLEFNYGMCLAAHPDTLDLQEQVLFEWRDPAGDLRDHFFDFVVTRTDGSKLAYTVKPMVWNRDAFAENMPHIAEQARASRRFSDVRLLSDTDLDRVSLFNAKLLHACRAEVPDHDAVARSVVRDMSGEVTSGGEPGLRTAFQLLQAETPKATDARDRNPGYRFGRLYHWLALKTNHDDRGPIRDVLRKHIVATEPVTSERKILGVKVRRNRIERPKRLKPAGR